MQGTSLVSRWSLCCSESHHPISLYVLTEYVVLIAQPLTSAIAIENLAPVDLQAWVRFYIEGDPEHANAQVLKACVGL